jgi:hypothetical protein
MWFDESLAMAGRMNRQFPNSVKPQAVYPSVDSAADPSPVARRPSAAPLFTGYHNVTASPKYTARDDEKAVERLQSVDRKSEAWMRRCPGVQAERPGRRGRNRRQVLIIK